MDSSNKQRAEVLMSAAIAEAGKVDLRNDLNPHVGAVLVDETGAIVATGFHRGSGTAHAEVDAISKVTDASGLTLYTTLEPCNSTGKQGPCSHAIVAAGIKKVVVGQLDSNPAMAGGVEYLRANGVEVETGILAAGCAALNESWNFAHANNRPWLVWKIATSFDGYIAASDGSSKWITGVEARAEVQVLRSQVGAVLTGTGTALADDPELTVRTADVKQPLRVIVGTRELPASAKLFAGENPALHIPGDIDDVLKKLWQEFGVHRVLVEAGPGLSTELWRRGLINEVYWYQAPLILGSGLKSIADLGVSTLNDGLRFSDYTVNRVGLDLVIHFRTN